MKNLLTILLGLALLLALAAFASAEGPDIDTGNYLLQACGDAMKIIDEDYKNADAAEANYCFGYVRATYQSLQFLEYYDKDSGICTPDHATGAQIVRIVVKYMKANPEELSRQPYHVASKALANAFPCAAK